jgi:Fe-S-cluster containining protein
MMKKDIRDMSAEEILSQQTLSLDDTFLYRCKACGKCCKNRDDIVLSAYDVFRIARFFGRTPAEIITRYFEMYEGRQTRLPVVWLKPVPPYNACPFLRGKRCSVHVAKPCVCRVYPLARVYTATGKAQYIQASGPCSQDVAPIMVRDWIGDFSTEESDRIGRVWTDFIFCLTYAKDPSRFSCTPQIEQDIFKAIAGLLYLQYQVNMPFLPQLEANIEELRDLLQNSYSLYVPTTQEYLKIAANELEVADYAHQ